MRSSGDPFNRLYEHMLPFHSNFRQSFAFLQRFLPQSGTMSQKELQMFLAKAGQLCHHLETHHTIEETYIFPLLAKRMPSFAHGHAHEKEHAVMHSALESLEAFVLQSTRALESSQGKRAIADGSGQGQDGKGWPKEVYDQQKFAELLTGLGQALFPHLDAEEDSLKSVNMKKAGWTVEELARIPM